MEQLKQSNQQHHRLCWWGGGRGGSSGMSCRCAFVERNTGQRVL